MRTYLIHAIAVFLLATGTAALAQTQLQPGPTKPPPTTSPLTKPGADMVINPTTPRQLEAQPQVGEGAIRKPLRADEGGRVGAATTLHVKHRGQQAAATNLYPSRNYALAFASTSANTLRAMRKHSTARGTPA